MTDNMQNEIREAANRRFAGFPEGKTNPAESEIQAGYRAADISQPTDHLEMDGKTYPLSFDLASMRVAEDVYELQYGRNLNFATIVKHLAVGKLGAVMAVLYGALLSGAEAHNIQPMTWAEFADKFRLTSIPAVKELLMEKVKQALPKAEGEGEGGNPQ